MVVAIRIRIVPDADLVVSARSPYVLAYDAMRSRFVRQLQRAYSGELAAALAYRGHWRSLPRGGGDRERVGVIEQEELHHRRLVGAMLVELAAAPSRWREARAFVLGHLLGLLCRVAGYFLPMYAAGKLESRNVGEYEDAARYAAECGREDLVPCFVEMARVEADHEAFFRGRVMGHRALKLFPLWRRSG